MHEFESLESKTKVNIGVFHKIVCKGLGFFYNLFSYIFAKSQQNISFGLKLVELPGQHFTKENFSTKTILTCKLFIT